MDGEFFSWGESVVGIRVVGWRGVRGWNGKLFFFWFLFLRAVVVAKEVVFSCMRRALLGLSWFLEGHELVLERGKVE